MITRQYTVEFLTPAFLGNAEQNGQWRTPPFKHLLREWWRVAWAEQKDYPAGSSATEKMKSDESALFGSASGSSGHKSRLRMRLDKWHIGSLQKRDWKPLGQVRHPEVPRNNVEAGLYLGYGPLLYDKSSRNTALKPNAAIQAGERATLSLAWPDAYGDLLERAIALAHAFGTLGGRSRNGWGSSIFLEVNWPQSLPLRDWRQCLDRDWVHAIGEDERGPLVWETEPFSDWHPLMQLLAQIKIDLRTTQFKFRHGKTDQPEERHWLSYPVTKHEVISWKGSPRSEPSVSYRLPNTLRYKVVRKTDGKLYGRIFHTPCLPPSHFKPKPATVAQVWQKVHAFLDAAQGLKRSCS